MDRNLDKALTISAYLAMVSNVFPYHLDGIPPGYRSHKYPIRKEKRDVSLLLSKAREKRERKQAKRLKERK